MFWTYIVLFGLFYLALIVSGVGEARKRLADGHSLGSALCNVYFMIPAAIIGRFLCGIVFGF